MLLGGKDSGDDGVGVDVGVVGSREPGGTSVVETRLSATGISKTAVGVPGGSNN